MLLLLFACAGDGHTLSAQLSQDKELVMVKGQSNLPDQAQITAALIDTQSDPPEVIVQEFGNVTKGSFEAKLKPLKPIKAGTYMVRLTYSPASYDWSGGKVTDVVGKKGENLKGSLVREDEGGMKYLENTVSFEYKEP